MTENNIKNIIKKIQRRIQKEMHLSTLIGIILLLVGISLASFPYLQNMYYQSLQESQVEQKLEDFQQTEKESSDSKENPSFIRNNEHHLEYPEELEPDNGILEIPAINLQLKIEYGVELPDLESGPGFYPESGYPDTGNVSIAGHRTTYGAPFRNLDQLNEGNIIILYYRGNEYYYKVSDVFDTHSRDWSVIDPTPKPALTLTTCHPPGSDERRLIVRAYLDGTTNTASRDNYTGDDFIH